MAEEQMMEDQMGDDPGMAAGAPTPLTALEVITKRPAMRKKYAFELTEDFLLGYCWTHET